MNPNRTKPADQSIGRRTARRFIIGFGWFTVMCGGAAMVVGSVAITMVKAWVRLGEQASDLSGPDTASDPAAFFAEAFKQAYGGITLASLLAVCGIVLFLIGGIGIVLGFRRRFSAR